MNLKILFPALYVFVGFLIYGQSLSNEFVMDDEEQIVNNSMTESLKSLPEIWKGHSVHTQGFTRGYGVYYRPLMLTCFTAFRSIFGLDSRPLHTFQLLLHLMNTLLLFLLLQQFATIPVAGIAGLLFLTHPMNTEAVVYIAALQDPLFAFFGMLALMFLVLVRQMTWLHVAPLALLFALSLFAKETGALLIAFSCLYTWMYRRDAFLKAFTGGLASVAVYLAARLGFAGLSSLTHSSTQLARATWEVKALTLPKILFTYLSQFVFPHTLATTQDWMVTTPTLPGFWLPLAALTVFLGGGLYGLTRVIRQSGWDSPIVFFAAWTATGLGLHVHLIAPLDGTVAERWFYIPCMGLIGLTALMAQNFLARASHPSLRLRRSLSLGLSAVFLLGFALKSYARSLQWQNGFTLYSRDVISQPDSAHLQNNVGVELFRRGEMTKAREHFEKSIQLNPAWEISWNNLGAIYQRFGNLKKAEECYLKSMEYGIYLLAYQNYATILAQQGRKEELTVFLKDRALPVFPNDPVLNQLK